MMERTSRGECEMLQKKDGRTLREAEEQQEYNMNPSFSLPQLKGDCIWLEMRPPYIEFTFCIPAFKTSPNP